ncbi:3-deoxy-7-phosphoheptulonate synthase [Candidatus Peregrinibacteria bacterium]|jgi:3-deoxy-7-phosphoheptulonate synthase|nr:3-deoxy-7-phosphoheptulonate synthase [Candidatus Peregrinibacteria bacterium]MBT4056075.1 3-deoxy-7-phosphoheptulonate synthase [Candidatus Peregrinibacteria bacterium]
MLIVMKNKATKTQIKSVVKAIEKLSLKAEQLPGAQRTAIGVTGNKDYIDQGRILNFPGVKEIIHVTKKYKLVSREFKPQNSKVRINKDITFGGKAPVIIAGPCSIESYEQLLEIARKVKALGADMLRGGAYKPRTSPYSFQGLEEEGLEIMSKVSKKIGIPTISEITSTDQLDLFKKHTDMIQIGARNMHNFDLLKKVAKLDKPILLKRGMSATMEEFLLAAEYILNEGNPNVVLCERGIRTFEQSTRNILDLNTVALIKEESHLPIIVDPSHAAGRYDLVAPLAKAGLAVGADGLIVEVHNDPKNALSDGGQSLTFDSFKSLIKEL